MREIVRHILACNEQPRVMQPVVVQVSWGWLGSHGPHL